MAAAPDSAECPVPVQRDSASGWEGSSRRTGAHGRGDRGNDWNRAAAEGTVLDPALKVPSLPPSLQAPPVLPGSREIHAVLVALLSGFEFVPNAQLLVYIIYHLPNSSSPSIPVDIDILVFDKK